MIAYALIVTLVLGLLVGSVATLYSAFRSSECCPMCSEPILKLVEAHKKKAEADNTILSYDNA